MVMLVSQTPQVNLGHRLHPVFHAITSQPGNRVDKAQVLPSDLKSVDLEEWLEILSEPPKFNERLCPVSLQFGQSTLRGKSLPDLMIKGYRQMARIFSGIGRHVLQAGRAQHGEPGMVPFMSLAADPDLWERLINADYDDGETTHATFMNLIRRGVVTPCVTIPFGALLPTFEAEFDVRMLVRLALFHDWHLLEAYHAHMAETHGDERFIVTVWFPEGGISRRVLEIFREEFLARAEAAGKSNPHLVLLLDNHQVPERDNDRLMKSWNMMRLDEDDEDFISVIFRDRSFSEWVSRSNPSVKKLLDRTIAKVDAELNAIGADYCWGHFEELECLFLAPKSVSNYEQKMTKLTELGYLPVAPDAFVRRKMTGQYGCAPDEPRVVVMQDDSGWAGWHGDDPATHLGRWLGVRGGEEPAPEPVRRMRRPCGVNEEGETEFTEERAPQCWKIALNRALAEVTEQVRGNPRTFKGGALGVLRSLVKSKNEKTIRRNIERFIEHWALCHWSEHFIQHDLSEAEINIPDLINDHLLADCRGKLTEKEMMQAAGAVQAYFLCLDARRANAFAWESLDNRGVYQAVLMACSSLVNMIYVHHWRRERGQEKACHDLLRERFINFHQLYRKYRLSKLGVKETDWKRAIRSGIPESKENVVRRAARRCTARHLRPLGYRQSADDTQLTSSVGHLWAAEMNSGNFRWDNPRFCGIPED